MYSQIAVAVTLNLKSKSVVNEGVDGGGRAWGRKEWSASRTRAANSLHEDGSHGLRIKCWQTRAVVCGRLWVRCRCRSLGRARPRGRCVRRRRRRPDNARKSEEDGGRDVARVADFSTTPPPPRRHIRPLFTRCLAHVRLGSRKHSSLFWPSQRRAAPADPRILVLHRPETSHLSPIYLAVYPSLTRRSKIEL